MKLHRPGDTDRNLGDLEGDLEVEVRDGEV